jgi:polyhydroxyalkanoate synthase subunit PhaC
MTEAAAAQSEVAEKLRAEIDRAIQRNIKGLEFLTAPKQAVGTMPKETLLRRGTLQLYHYHPSVDEVYRVPILIVSPTSNRGYIFDLARGQSLVEFLLARGYDVYMIDWLPPRRDESHLRLENYLLDFIPACRAIVRERSGQDRATLLGYCVGGTLSLLYAALNPEHIANLVLFATPVDFTRMALFRAWGDERHFDVDRLVDTVGNIPGEFFLSAFDLMRPANRTAGVLQLWTNMWNDDYVKSYRMFDRWAAETLPLAGEYFRQSTKEFLWRNSIMTGELFIGGQRIDLKKVSAPVLSIVAQHDHVVPHPAAHPIMELVGSAEHEELIVKGGHVSVVAGPSAVTRLWPSIDQWLAKRSV